MVGRVSDFLKYLKDSKQNIESGFLAYYTDFQV